MASGDPSSMDTSSLPPPGMAAPHGSAAVSVSTYPLPPLALIHQYSDEAVAAGSVPPPPMPPQPGASYSALGFTYLVDEDNVIQTLESQNIRQLLTPHQAFDRKREFKKLLASALTNFMDLLDILVYCPRSPRRKEKLEDINLIFIHMQHLVNELRPHQVSF